MKIFQKVQGNLATNLYVTSNNKTASVKNADSVYDSDLELLDADLDLGLPDSDGLWLDKYNGLWEVCADEAMMIHDSSSALGLDDDLEVVPFDQLGEFAPFRRAELEAVGRKANASAFASKPVASVNVMLTRMNVKTGSERLLKSFKTSSADEALKLAEKWFGKMTDTTYGKIGVKVWIYKGEVLPAKKVYIVITDLHVVCMEKWWSRRVPYICISYRLR